MDQLIEETGLAVILKETGLDETRTKFITDNFAEYEAIAEEWQKKAQALVVTSEDQVAEMKMAREGRLFLQKKRTAVEKSRKELKQPSIDEGRAIDTVAKYLTGLIEPIETYLEQQEKFAELLAKERQLKKQAERMARLEPYNLAVEPGMIGSMTDQMFESYIKGVDADAKAEAERVRKEEEERLEEQRKAALNIDRDIITRPYWQFHGDVIPYFGEMSEDEFQEYLSKLKKAKAEHDAEQERIRKENERLRKEAEEKEAQLAKERAAAEEKARKEREAQEVILRKEREERERVQAELQAKRDAEEAQRRADEAKAKQEAEALKKAEKAPDKTKLLKWVNDLNLPEVSLKSEESKIVYNDLRSKFEGFKVWAQKQVEAL